MWRFAKIVWLVQPLVQKLRPRTRTNTFAHKGGAQGMHKENSAQGRTLLAHKQFAQAEGAQAHKDTHQDAQGGTLEAHKDATGKDGHCERTRSGSRPGAPCAVAAFPAFFWTAGPRLVQTVAPDPCARLGPGQRDFCKRPYLIIFTWSHPKQE